ncbi:hypothetical protein [Pseudomonas endophytica]
MRVVAVMDGVPERVLFAEQVAALVVTVGVGTPAAVGDAQRQRPMFGVVEALAAAQRVAGFDQTADFIVGVILWLRSHHGLCRAQLLNLRLNQDEA